MFQIIQSNDTDVLVDELINFYKNPHQNQADFSAMIFTPFVVIVPSMVLGHWLEKQVALKAGISTMMPAQFWGQYQWKMIKQTLELDGAMHHNDALAVPEVAMLSASVMRWRLFGFLSAKAKPQELLEILNNDQHELYFLFRPLAEQSQDQYEIPDHRLWQACDELSRLYVRYLVHRPEWLDAWGDNESLENLVEEMIAGKDRFGDEYGQKEATPDWLVAHYKNLEKLLRHLWYGLFRHVYQMRQKLEHRFWDILEGRRSGELRQAVLNKLPKDLYLFTVQQLPQVELLFLKRLSLAINIRLLHFNPSKMFWADIVDKNWLLTQNIINPNAVYKKDYGHGLLSRLGKESRETFAMLADMSGGEFYYEDNDNQQLNYIDNLNNKSALHQIYWQDKFQSKTSGENDSILNQLKQDILMLGEDEDVKGMAMGEVLQILSDKKRPKSVATLSELSKTDKELLPSLSVHACHGLKRQLEIARTMIAKYLNDHQKKPSDVVILLPDVEEVQNTIRAVFPDGVGVDGLYLPIKITGTTAREIDELLQAMLGFYRLCGVKHARFYADEFYEWLMNPAVYENFGLSFDEAYRARSLLEEAGFRRGFDASYIGQTLHYSDTDYRYTFSYALDRIVMGFVAPNQQLPSELLYPFDWTDGASEATLALGGIVLNDKNIVQALCRMHEALAYFGGQYQQRDKVQHWLNRIEHELIDDYFYAIKQTTKMRAIFEAKNAMLASLRANAQHSSDDDIYLTLEFVLESLSEAVGLQAVAAEPADVITVARFGSLRSVPFGLTVMLGMNLSAFPRQDRSMRLDLMRAGLKRRGDRSNEDDDNGAFLDALLCTKDTCLIFYDGMSADGSTALLPASPVTELLEFLKSGMDWQLPDLADDLTRRVGERLPGLIEHYLLTRHEAMSFERSLFYRDDGVIDDDDPVSALTSVIDDKKRELQSFLPPAPLWQNVRQVLDDRLRDTEDKSFVTLPTDDELARIQAVFTKVMTGSSDADQLVDDLLSACHIELPSYLTVQTINSAIKSPAKSYLQGKLMVLTALEGMDRDEPLSMGGLEGWRLSDTIVQTLATGVFDGKNINEMDVKALFDVAMPSDLTPQRQQKLTQFKALRHEPLLPAGATKYARLKQDIELVSGVVDEFWTQLNNANGSLVGQLEVDGGSSLNFSAFITSTQEQAIPLHIGTKPLKILAQLPDFSSDHWLNVLVSSTSSDKLLGFWVQHLLWQIHRQTTAQDERTDRGMSIWRYKKGRKLIKPFSEVATIVMRPICSDKAMRYLKNLILFAVLTRVTPLVITADNALKILSLDDTPVEDLSLDDCIGKDTDYSSKDLHWEALLQGQNVDQAMRQAAILAKPLYGDVLAYMTTLENLNLPSAQGDAHE